MADSSGSVPVVETLFEKNLGTILALIYGVVAAGFRWVQTLAGRVQALETGQSLHAVEQAHIRSDLAEIKTTAKETHNQVMRALERLDDRERLKDREK